MSAPGQFRRHVAVVVGIDAYLGGIPVLRSAVNDARRLGEVLASEHGFDVQMLFDADATYEALDDLLKTQLPAEIGPDDRVCFYFAGHGIAVEGDDGPDGFILPQDARRGDSDSYFPMTRLHDALEALPCRHMLVVLDSCFSGAFRWSSMRDVMTMPTVIHQERYDRFVHDPAWQVLTSAAYDQTAADQLLTGSLGSRGDSGVHSPFALALLEGLAGAADLAPAGGDGIITATELYLYLEQRLQVETVAQRRRQTPGLWPLRRHDKGEFVFLVPGRELDLPPAPPLTYDNNPYRGLASYNKEDASLFFGRTAVVDALAARVAERPVTVVLGASGSGKSSVVKAGLVPRLELGGWRAPAVIRPGALPFHALAKALSLDQETVAPTEEAIQESMRLLLRDGTKAVLVIDQFEELVTLTHDPNVRARFLDLLADLSELGGSHLRIILTLRTDFEAQFDQSRLRDLWHAGRFVVPPLSRQDYREVIEGPASQRVIYFEPASLVDTLLDDVTAMPGGLPLLSFTLSEMYRRYVERAADNRALTQDDYEALGGVSGALRSRADAEVDSLDGPHQDTLRRLMLRMVAVEQGTLARQRVTKAELDHWDAAESGRIATVLGRLSHGRLVVEGVDAEGVAYVEPAHDALVSSWRRLLDWTHDAQHREPDLHFLHALSRTARDWSSAGRNDRAGLLWRDKIRSSRLWALRRVERVQFNQQEDRFCIASLARRRFVRNGLVALVTTIVVSGLMATGLGVVAQQQRTAALSQRDEAQRQTRAAWSRTLTAKAATALDVDRDSTMALKLAAAALEADSANAAAAMLIRRATYGGGVMRYRGRPYAAPMHVGLPHSASWAVWAPDGAHFAIGWSNMEESGREVVAVLSPDGTEVSRFQAGFEFMQSGARFSADGRYVFPVDESVSSAFELDGHAVSPSFAATIRPGPSPGRERAWESVGAATVGYETAVTPDGRFRAGQSVEEWVRRRGSWEFSPDETTSFVMSYHALTDEDERPRGPFAVMKDGHTVSEVPGEWTHAALTWDGRYLATGSFDGTVALWDVERRGAVRLADLTQGDDQVEALAFSPDGTYLVVSSLRSGLHVWHLTARPLATVDEMPGVQPPAMVSADGQVVAVLTSDGDYDAHLEVRDAASGTRWTRDFGTTDTHAVVLSDGLVAVSDTSYLWLIDAKGVEQARVPVDGSGLRATADQRALQLMWDGASQQAVVLPVASADLIAIAREAGPLALTPADATRWDVVEIVSGLQVISTQARASDSLFSFLTQSVRDLFFGEAVADTHEDVLSEGQTPVELPEVWTALGLAHDAPPVEFVSVTRSVGAELREAGVIAAVRSMGGPQVFLDGPHTDDGWNLGSETFGHYNPAFVGWLATLVPDGREGPRRLATQPLYDRVLRRVTRLHALALEALDANPELRREVTTAYRDVSEGRGDYLLTAVNPMVVAMGPTPEGEPRDVASAIGFWIRREIDGTAPNFRVGLAKLLRVYDPDVHPAPEAGGAVNEAWVRSLWNGLSSPSCRNPDPERGDDPRTVYCALIQSGVLPTLEAIAGTPIFLSGPHRGAELNLTSQSFGTYNPAFVRWAYETLLPAPGNRGLIALTAPMYARVVQEAGRASFLALKVIDEHPEIVGPLVMRLQQGQPAESLLRDASFALDSGAVARPKGLVGEAALWHYKFAIGFWLRRSSDGTRGDFEAGLRRMLQVYDPGFLATQDTAPITPGG